MLNIKRSKPELLLPAMPTPHETKKLSDIDDSEALRFQVPVVMFYRSIIKNNGNGSNDVVRDPVKVIKDAVSKALVPYYPLAGRLKEDPHRKLIVDCCGELGVLFVEATADVTLHQLGESIQPPCPFIAEFLSDVSGSDGITQCPLLLIQVTRLRCGGFVLAIRINHTMVDALGFVQFLRAIAEFANGATEPSIRPVWYREVLNARRPPRITHAHREFETTLSDDNNGSNITKVSLGFSNKPFFFGRQELKALQAQVKEHCSRFDLITACLWKCRTVALDLDPEEDVFFAVAVNARSNGNMSVSIPPGYYGNAFAYPMVVAKAGEVCRNPFLYAMQLVKKAKSAATGDYLQSVADFMVINGRPGLVKRELFIVSDNSRVGYEDVEFGGWERPIVGGPARGFPNLSFCVSYRRSELDEGVVVPMCLPPLAMQVFSREVKKMTQSDASMFSGLDNEIKVVPRL